MPRTKLTAGKIAALLDSTNPPDYVKWHRERISTCVQFLNDNLELQGTRTLDLGHDVHVGALLAHLGCKLRGNVAPSEMQGHESARDTCDFTSPDGTVRQWNIDEFDFEKHFPYEDAAFDLVTTMEVIEHVSISPREFLAEIKRVLVPRGYLYVATPNAASWTKIMRSLSHAPTYDAKPYSQNFGPRHTMCHVYEYTPWELKELLRTDGFEIVGFATWNPYSSDFRGPRAEILRTLLSASLALTGFVRQSALMYHDRGHQMGLLARLK